jgi:protein ImuA
MHESLHALLEDPRLWRAGRRERHWPTLPSGYPELDALLPGGGWPAAMLTEVAVERWGSGELALFMPLLARLCTGERARATGWLAWVSPPFLPYAPALAAAGVDLSRLLLVRGRGDAETLWAAEQALQSGSCRAVLAWAGQADGRRLRRLQLAAESGHTPLILFRPPQALATPSPAALRLRLAAGAGGARLHLVKHRGGASGSLSVAALQER